MKTMTLVVAFLIVSGCKRDNPDFHAFYIGDGHHFCLADSDCAPKQSCWWEMDGSSSKCTMQDPACSPTCPGFDPCAGAVDLKACCDSHKPWGSNSVCSGLYVWPDMGANDPDMGAVRVSPPDLAPGDAGRDSGEQPDAASRRDADADADIPSDLSDAGRKGVDLAMEQDAGPRACAGLGDEAINGQCCPTPQWMLGEALLTAVQVKFVLTCCACHNGSCYCGRGLPLGSLCGGIFADVMCESHSCSKQLHTVNDAGDQGLICVP